MPADIISSTTQQFLDIHDITNNFVIMKDGTVSVILTVDAMNFGLLAEEEQDAIMYAYAGLLNSLNYPIQILIHSQTKDVTVYLQLLKDQEEGAASDTMRRRIRQYREFVGNLIHERNVLDKKFYVTIPATALELGIAGASGILPGQNKFDISQIERSVLLEKAQNLLDPKRDHLISQFARIGLFSRQLTTQEIIQLFYVRYNPEAIEGQQIAESRSYTAPLVQASIQESAMSDNLTNLPPSAANSGVENMPSGSTFSSTTGATSSEPMPTTIPTEPIAPSLTNEASNPNAMNQAPIGEPLATPTPPTSGSAEAASALTQPAPTAQFTEQVGELLVSHVAGDAAPSSFSSTPPSVPEENPPAPSLQTPMEKNLVEPPSSNPGSPNTPPSHEAAIPAPAPTTPETATLMGAAGGADQPNNSAPPSTTTMGEASSPSGVTTPDVKSVQDDLDAALKSLGQEPVVGNAAPPAPPVPEAATTATADSTLDSTPNLTTALNNESTIESPSEQSPESSPESSSLPKSLPESPTNFSADLLSESPSDASDSPPTNSPISSSTNPPMNQSLESAATESAASKPTTIAQSTQQDIASSPADSTDELPPLQPLPEI